MTSHSEWYSQRYGNASGLQKRTEATAANADKYKALNEKKQTQRQQKLSSAELVFLENQVPYQVVRSGVWLVNYLGEEIYFYPTTNRWRVKGKKTTYYSRGALDFLGKVWKFQNPELIRSD